MLAANGWVYGGGRNILGEGSRGCGEGSGGQGAGKWCKGRGKRGLGTLMSTPSEKYLSFTTATHAYMVDSITFGKSVCSVKVCL